ncbi:MAG: tetratricopeptide repeat protein [bacterium]|nr:tetratricopeptide repeat protein [bacterium]
MRYWENRQMRAVGIVCVIAALAWGCGERRSQQFAEQGATYLQLGDTDAALEQFRKAAESDPSNVRAPLGIARCLRVQEDLDGAMQAYQEAIALDPGLADAYLEAVQVLLEQEDLPAASTMADRFAEIDAEQGGILRAHVANRKGDGAGALAVLTETRKQFPESMAVRLSLAGAYLAAKQPAQAEKELQDALTDIDPGSLVARMLLIEVYQAQGKMSEILAQLESLVESRPDDDNMKLALARALLDSGDYDKAMATARPVLDRVPESPWANYVVGSCLLQQDEKADAIQCLRIAARSLPEQRAVQARLRAATGTGEEPVQPTPDPDGTVAVAAQPPAEGWLALWRTGSLAQLLATRDSFDAAADPELAEALALSAVFVGNAKLADELAARLPETSPVRSYFAALQARDQEQIAAVLKAWPEATGEREIMRRNAEGFALAAVGARARAVGVLSKCAGDAPENGVALFNLAMMYRGANMPRFAARVLERLVANHPASIEARLLLFRVLTEADAPTDARRSAESTYGLFPQSRPALVNLARIYRQTGNVRLAVEALKRGLDAAPASAALNLALAEALLHEGDWKGALGALDKAALPESRAPQDAFVRAFCAAASGDWDAVAKQGERGGADAPLAVRLVHAAALFHAGEAEAAGARVLSMGDAAASVVRKAPVVLAAGGALPADAATHSAELGGALAGNLSAATAYTYGRACQEAGLHEEAFKALTAADGMIGGQPRIIGLALGSLALSTGFEDRAAQAEAVTGKYPELPAAWLGRAQVARVLRDTDLERTCVERAVALAPGDGGVMMRVVDLYEREGQYEAALAEYRKLAALDPDNPLMANNVAYSILRVDGDVQEALTLADKAVAAFPANPHIRHTLGLAQLRGGQGGDAMRNLAICVEMLPGDPTFLLDYGQALVAEGRAEDGRRQIELAIEYADKLGLEFARRAEAEAILSQQ